MQSDRAFEGYAAVLSDAVDLFEALKLRYALVGGLAAMIHGRARFTEDVDVVIVAGHQQILAANPQAMKRHHFDPTCTYMLYHHNGVNIDIWKDEHSERIIERAATIEWHDRKVCVAEPHDLIAMKLRANRPQDDYDISEILKHTAIDDPTIAARVSGEQFEHFQSIRKRIATS